MFCEILRMYACMPLLNRVGLVWVHCRLLRIQGYNIMDSILIKVGKNNAKVSSRFLDIYFNVTRMQEELG